MVNWKLQQREEEKRKKGILSQDKNEVANGCITCGNLRNSLGQILNKWKLENYIGHQRFMFTHVMHYKDAAPLADEKWTDMWVVDKGNSQVGQSPRNI